MARGDERENLKNKLKRQLKNLAQEIEDTDRRDPFRHDLYAQRRELQKAIQVLDDETAWETEMAVLARSMPEAYGGW